MKNVKMKLAILGVFGALSTQAMATGLVALPSAGLAVAATTNQPAGTTAYVRCNTTGNYGGGSAVAPTAGANNACAVFPATDLTSPVAGYTLAFSANNSAVTANAVSLAKRNTRVFRTADQKMCIFGTQFQMDTTTTFDYDTGRAGNNTLEVNDISFAGFSQASSVNAGYFFKTGSSSSVYRVGRTYTAVQAHNSSIGNFALATNFVHRPITASAPAASTSINGPSPLGSEAYPGSPTAAQQAAALSANWVTFTMDVTGGADEDVNSTEPFSPYLYVEAPCKDANPVVAGTPAALTDGVVLKQTGQETQPWVTVKTPSSYSPQGASATVY